MWCVCVWGIIFQETDFFVGRGGEKRQRESLCDAHSAPAPHSALTSTEVRRHRAFVHLQRGTRSKTPQWAKEVANSAKLYINVAIEYNNKSITAHHRIGQL